MTERRTGTAPAKTPGARVPTVIADDLHIVYRVYGTGAGKGSATAALNRIVRRKPSTGV
ncbi:ABC transporter ATP-binding protein, partial [Streptomyces angustmyceticus]